jgi:hypothetical protein
MIITKATQALPSMEVAKAFAMKNWAIILLVILLLLFLSSDTKAIETTTLHDVDKDNIPDGWYPNAITDELHLAMEDWFGLKGRKKEEIWERMLALSDGQLKLMYNYYATAYSVKTEMSMTEMINSEMGNIIGHSQKDSLIKRLYGLNLK